MKRLNCLLFATAIFAASHAHAQNALHCLNTTTDGSGKVTIQNNCPYQVHYYWIPYNAPDNHFNNYLSPGAQDTFRPDGGYRLYACDSHDLVVGPDGRVITHLVDSFSCKKN